MSEAKYATKETEAFDHKVIESVKNYLLGYGIDERLVNEVMETVIGFEVSGSEAAWLDSAVVLGAKAIELIGKDESGSAYISKYKTDIDGPNVMYHKLSIRKGRNPFVMVSADGVKSRAYANVGTITHISPSSQAGSDYQTEVYFPEKLVSAAIKKEKPNIIRTYLIKKATFVQLPTIIRRKLEPNTFPLRLPPQIVIARRIVPQK